MAKISGFSALGKVPPDQFHKEASPVIQETVDTVNGKLEFDTNMNTQTVTVKFPVANTDLAIGHKLNKTTINYLVGSKSVDCSVYNGATANTKNTVYLRSTQAATVTLILF
jgi:formate dehydrogenase assembly factor FdhD